MSTSTLTQLRQLQQSLYDKAYKEAHAIVGDSSRTILSYSVKFGKSLPQRYTRTTQAEVLQSLRQHQFILYGDFHTLRQSQRGLLRLIRSYVDRYKTDKVVICLEMFKAVDQDFLDGYLANALSDDAFLDNINYAAEWGFPWQNFKMILDYARTRRLPVIGINTENAGRDNLLTRDRFAAKCLVQAAQQYPDHKIICLIGEYHLADGHLPRALATADKRGGGRGHILRILNNVDQYYFQLHRRPAHASTEYLRLRKDFYCIMNSPPWMKWQSFSLWEEMRHVGAWQSGGQDSDFEHNLDLYNEETYDVDFQFLNFVRELAGFLELGVDSSDMESFHIHFSPGGEFYKDLTRDGEFDPAEAKRIVGRASVDGVYFLGRTNTVLLTNISINNLAEASGQYLHTLLTGFDEGSGGKTEDFNRRVLKSAVGMIASMILNPRRKCMELHHYRQVARRHRSRQKGAKLDLRARTTNAILRFDRWMELKLAKKETSLANMPRAFILLDEETDYELSRAIGQMLGFTLYKKVIANKISSARIRRLFKKKVSNAAVLWREIAWLYSLMQR